MEQYHGIIKVTEGHDIQVELGVPNSKNPEHKANIHLYVPTLGHIRGIICYAKDKGDHAEWFLRMPSYKRQDGAEIAQVHLNPYAVEQIINLVKATPADKLHKTYCHNNWGIWGSMTKNERQSPGDRILEKEMDRTHGGESFEGVDF